jgi:hypothetical protein
MMRIRGERIGRIAAFVLAFSPARFLSDISSARLLPSRHHARSKHRHDECAAHARGGWSECRSFSRRIERKRTNVVGGCRLSRRARQPWLRGVQIVFPWLDFAAAKSSDFVRAICAVLARPDWCRGGMGRQCGRDALLFDRLDAAASGGSPATSGSPRYRHMGLRGARPLSRIATTFSGCSRKIRFDSQSVRNRLRASPGPADPDRTPCVVSSNDLPTA